ncbi:hypothetical protein Pmar_PMAR008187 [Perkinsus marinus ATCC 50983]|uniref:Uncharacterized protein n=1 Tax=Perkinsus marinus (strain ATCC 50983 / TXsc) TaxID=423536 RepID=C5LNH0_PERM5|nr:hypothetical protein Pmar_PMAR008187 [Perkinsus marinus ATCC 50983]EER01721.1 hypothetical protein Pmar_PMAR008187 [Perkinsus marinus ATCC 50983]|eukprot:XP_002769003.1 hypothetical protein Pmar_PMAR008187 [Perkinsus marinus ATCC 50983]
MPGRLRLDVERGSDYLRRVSKERERRAEAQKLRELEREAEELAPCTFKPAINKAPQRGKEKLRQHDGNEQDMNMSILQVDCAARSAEFNATIGNVVIYKADVLMFHVKEGELTRV